MRRARRTTLRSLLALLTLLPLLAGCAAGVGNFGPGMSAMSRTGTREEHSSTNSRGERAPEGYEWVRRYEEHAKWKGAFTLGLAVGPATATLTEMRDTTVDRSKYFHSDVVVNLPGDAWGIGGTVGYLSTEFDSRTGFGPDVMKYSGITVGPTLYRRINRYLNVDVGAQHIFGSIEDINAFYLKPVYGMLDPKQPMAGTRYNADVNLFFVRSERVDLGVRAGYQWTKTKATDVYLKSRQYTSEGPMLELIMLGF